MKRSIFSLLGITFTLTILLVSSPPSSGQNPTNNQQDDEVVRVTTSLVTIPVQVTDRRGKTIGGLRREDFKIFENGVEREIAYFVPPETGGLESESTHPLTLALLLDISDSTQYKIEQIQRTALAFLDSLSAGDRIMIVAFDKRVQIVTGPTNDRTVLRNAIAGLRTGGGTALYEAIIEVLSGDFGRVSGRKAMVLFTDGVDTSSSDAAHVNSIRAAERSDAVIYPIQYNTYADFADNPSRETYAVGGAGTVAHVSKGGEFASEAYKRGTLYLRLLADKSGGRFQLSDSWKNLSQNFSRIADTLRQHYSLGYYPPQPTGDGETRQIEVKVDVPDARVRARKNFVFRRTQK